MATTIDPNRANTFTQAQWDNQPPAGPITDLSHTSAQFQDQFAKVGKSLEKLTQDNTNLQHSTNAADYTAQLSNYTKDFNQLHQDAIQLINTAKTEGSPYEMGLANSLADQGRQLANIAPKPSLDELTPQQQSTAIDASNKILQAENDIQSAGTYTINGTSYNNDKYAYSNGSQYTDPNTKT